MEKILYSLDDQGTGVTGLGDWERKRPAPGASIVGNGGNGGD
jgi:hypothetical protein